MTNPQLPDYLQNRPFQPVSERLSDSLGMGAPPSVSIAGGRFTLVDQSGTEQPVTTAESGIPYLDCVVMDSLERISKIYYDHPYDPSQPGAPPTCWSDNGVAPSRNAAQPQSPTCASCEKGAWGSAVSRVDPTKKVKACQDYQKLALLVPGFNGIYLLRVPPNSLKPMREYNARFKGSGTDVADVITRISFEKDVLGTLNFRGVSYIDRDTAVRRNEALAKKATDGLVGRLDQPIQGAIAAPAYSQVGSDPLGAARPLAGPAPNVGFQLTAMELPQTQPLAAQPANPPSKRGRGRPRSDNGPQQAAGPAQAPFPTQSNPVPAGNAGGASFGISQGAQPGADLAQSLDNFFGPAPGEGRGG